MGWMQFMGSKVGHLLSSSLDRVSPSRLGHWHPNPAEGGHSLEVDDVGLEREQGHFHLQRAVSENDSRERFWGPDTSSLSSFLYSFFSGPEGEVYCADEERIRQRPDEGDPNDVPCYTSESGQYEVATSSSNEAPQREEVEGQIGKTKMVPGFHNEDLEEEDWHLLSEHEIGNLAFQAQMQEPSNVCAMKLPLMSETSLLLSEAFRRFLLPALPTLTRGRQWTLLYSTWKHGISLLTLYRRSNIIPGPYLLVIGDTKGATFGSLISGRFWPTPKKKYQGTSETFVYSDVSGEPVLYRPTGANRYFVLCTSDALAFGGGGHFALRLDGDLLTGSSGSSSTFGNTCLAHSEDFIVKNVELWGFAHSSRYVPPSMSYREPTEALGVCRW